MRILYILLLLTALSCSSKATVKSTPRDLGSPTPKSVTTPDSASTLPTETSGSSSSSTKKKTPATSSQSNSVKPVVGFLIDSPALAVAGSSFAVQIQAVNVDDEVVSDYAGQINLLCTGSSASGCGSANFVAGIADFSLTDILVETIHLTLSENQVSTRDISASSNVSVQAAAASKFVILNPTDSNTGVAAVVSIEVQDAYNNKASTYENDVTLVCSGAATGCGLVAITAGAGSMSVNDSTAQTVALSLSDSGATGLDVSSIQDLVFSVGVATKFVILNPSDSSAGSASTVNIEVQDANSIKVASYEDDVTLVCSGAASGCGLVAITAGAGSLSVNDLTAQTVALSLSDSGVTGLDVSSTQDLVFSAGAATKFVILNPSDSTAGTASTVNIEVQDANNNKVTSYNNDVTLVCSGAASGCGLVAITAGAGGLSVNDLSAQTVALSLSDSGVTGLDVSSTQDLVFSAGTATKFVILNPSDTAAGSASTVTIEAQDANNNKVSTYEDDVTLVCSGAASGCGLVDISSGAGSLPVNDLTAQTVSLSLSDSGVTGLNVSSTQDLVFSAGVATKFVILNPNNSTPGSPVTVSIEVQDANDNKVTSFNDDVTLLCSSGTATGCGLVAITSGAGSMSVSDAVAGTVSLTLDDSAATGLNIASSQDIDFLYSAPPNPTGVGATVDSSTHLTISWTSGGGSTAGYIIAYASGSTAPLNCTAGTVIPANQVSGTSKAVIGLNPLTEYSFRVCAINGNPAPNLSSGASISETTGSADGLSPTAPAVLNIESEAFTLIPSWSPSSGGAAVAGYLVVRRAGSAVTWTPSAGTTYSLGDLDGGTHTAVYAGANLSAEDSLLSTGTTYHYAVFAYDIEKDYSAAKTASETVRKHIYRSVQVGSWFTALAVGNSNALNITGNIASFATDLPNPVGVGDALEYDYNNSGAVNRIAFISRRISANQFYVLTAAGAAPTATTSDDQDWKLHRAYDTLFEAESGAENSIINSSLRDFDTFTTGRNLVANDEIWHIALYASSEPEVSPVRVTGWTTDANRYLQIYTPTKSTEVGVSQRHNGVWDDNSYRLQPDLANFDISTLIIESGYVRIEGIQLWMRNPDIDALFGIWVNYSAAQDIRLSHSIIRGSTNLTQNNTVLMAAYQVSGGASGNLRIWNNIFYDNISNQASAGALAISSTINAFIYNNTFYNCQQGIVRGIGNATAINNIVDVTSDGFSGTFTASSDYNISNIAADAPGTNSKQSSSATFIDASGRNLSLALADSVARNAGTDLSANANLSFNDDIQGDIRSGTWDIGADSPNTTAVAPTSENRSLRAKVDGSLNITLAGHDVNWDALTYIIVDNPAHGTLDTSSLPVVIYTPDSAYAGDDSFTYKVNDGGLDSAVGTISLDVTYYHRIVKISTGYYTGAAVNGLTINGLNSLDTICQAEADAVGLGGGSWKVIASSEAVDARDHIAVTYPIENLLGEPIANDAIDLWDGYLENRIMYDFAANLIDWDHYETGSNGNGTKVVGKTCNSWTSTTATAITSGNAHYSDSGYWINFDTWRCDWGMNFICIDRQ